MPVVAISYTAGELFSATARARSSRCRGPFPDVPRHCMQCEDIEPEEL